MANFDSIHTAWRPHLLSVLRIITGFLFVAHGTQKLFDYPSSGKGPVDLASFMQVQASEGLQIDEILAGYDL